MLYLITGANDYLAEQEVRRISHETGLVIRRVDGETINAAILTDYMVGSSLFGPTELPVIRALSENTAMWQLCADMCARASTDNHMVLREVYPDRRTKAYKAITAGAMVITCDPLTDRDTYRAIEWLVGEAKALGCKVQKAQLQQMVERALTPGDRPGRYVIDQMRLYVALEALSALPEITSSSIDAVLPPNTNENIFELFELAVRRDSAAIRRMVENLRLSEEPQKVYALLIGQLVQYATVVMAEEEATAFGIHPYVAQKLAALSKQITRAELRSILGLAASLDADMKLSHVAPWDAVDRLLISIATR